MTTVLYLLLAWGCPSDCPARAAAIVHDAAQRHVSTVALTAAVVSGGTHRRAKAAGRTGWRHHTAVLALGLALGRALCRMQPSRACRPGRLWAYWRAPQRRRIDRIHRTMRAQLRARAHSPSSQPRPAR